VGQAAAADADAAGEVEPTGHFRIYLGAAPGVGKTYAMLSEAQRRRERGADVVAGFVEAYGRPRTEALINGLEVVPRKVIDYRGTRPKEKVAQALTHFFRTDNLIALRELALRFVADESDEELLEHLQRKRSHVLWETTERIMAAVTSAPGTDAQLRRAARIALRFKGELDVVHVIEGDASPGADARAVEGLRQLTADLGARWHDLEDDDPARAIIGFARENQITQIVLGSIPHSWWHIADGGPVVRRVIHEAGALGIDVLLTARGEPPSGEAREPKAAPLRPA
jgi:K+-sensing histidine kinase KdpD